MTNPVSTPIPADTDVWMVTAIVQPFRLDVVALALEGIPEFSGMTVTECRGFGSAKVRSDRSPAAKSFAELGGDLSADYEPKVRIEVVVAGRLIADAIVATVVRAGRTGKHGDGLVLLWPLARGVRIENGKEGHDAF